MKKETIIKIKRRLPGGELFRSVIVSLGYLMKYRQKLYKDIVRDNLLIYWFGEVHVNRHGGTARSVLVKEIITSPVPLFHMTYTGYLPSIQEKGIDGGRGYVFLTDDVSKLYDFYHWKDTQLSENVGEYCILTVDTKRLAENHILLKLEAPNEILTDVVSSDCILEVSPY